MVQKYKWCLIYWLPAKRGEPGEIDVVSEKAFVQEEDRREGVTTTLGWKRKKDGAVTHYPLRILKISENKKDVLSLQVDAYTGNILDASQKCFSQSVLAKKRGFFEKNKLATANERKALQEQAKCSMSQEPLFPFESNNTSGPSKHAKGKRGQKEATPATPSSTTTTRRASTVRASTVRATTSTAPKAASSPKVKRRKTTVGNVSSPSPATPMYGYGHEALPAPVRSSKNRSVANQVTSAMDSTCVAYKHPVRAGRITPAPAFAQKMSSGSTFTATINNCKSLEGSEPSSPMPSLDEAPSPLAEADPQTQGVLSGDQLPEAVSHLRKIIKPFASVEVVKFLEALKEGATFFSKFEGLALLDPFLQEVTSVLQSAVKATPRLIKVPDEYFVGGPDKTEIHPNTGVYFKTEDWGCLQYRLADPTNWTDYVRAILVEIYGSNLKFITAKGRRGKTAMNGTLRVALYSFSNHLNGGNVSKTEFHGFINKLSWNRRNNEPRPKKTKFPTDEAEIPPFETTDQRSASEAAPCQVYEEQTDDDCDNNSAEEDDPSEHEESEDDDANSSACGAFSPNIIQGISDSISTSTAPYSVETTDATRHNSHMTQTAMNETPNMYFAQSVQHIPSAVCHSPPSTPLRMTTLTPMRCPAPTSNPYNTSNSPATFNYGNAVQPPMAQPFLRTDEGHRIQSNAVSGSGTVAYHSQASQLINPFNLMG